MESQFELAFRTLQGGLNVGKVVVRIQQLVAISQAPSLDGLWHAAGVLSDGLLDKLKAQALSSVYAPKAHGAWLLQLACATVPLRACMLFSSVAALFGFAGQANYSAANAYALTRLRSAAARMGRRHQACSGELGPRSGWRRAVRRGSGWPPWRRCLVWA
jgi:hypothetical protein